MKAFIVFLAIAAITAATGSFALGTAKSGEKHVQTSISRLEAAEAQALK